jgi:hypothetical protein
MVIASTTTANTSIQEHELRESRTSATASPREDSDLYKCLLVFVGFMAMFQVIGINSSYGVFQAYYSSEESFLPSNTSQASIAFVGTLGNKHSDLAHQTGYGLSWALGIFISPLMAKTKNYRMISCVGAILMSAGLIFASLSKSVSPVL